MILSRTATGKVLMLESILTEESRELLLKLPKPHKVCDKETPADLNSISLGTLYDLQEAVASEDMRTIVTECARILLGIAPLKLLRSRADYALGFALWVLRELERIAKMWSAISPKPSAEAVQAGIDKLDFGNFGTVDWYAQRMGIADHDIVMRLPWVRIFECMRIDNERGAFQERLREIMAKQSKKR